MEKHLQMSEYEINKTEAENTDEPKGETLIKTPTAGETPEAADAEALATYADAIEETPWDHGDTAEADVAEGDAAARAAAQASPAQARSWSWISWVE